VTLSRHDNYLRQFTHTRLRAMERLGLRLSRAEYDRAGNSIRNARLGQGWGAELVGEVKRGCEVWAVEIQGQRVKVIYDEKRGRIITICNGKWLRRLKHVE